MRVATIDSFDGDIFKHCCFDQLCNSLFFLPFYVVATVILFMIFVVLGKILCAILINCDMMRNELRIA